MPAKEDTNNRGARESADTMFGKPQMTLLDPIVLRDAILRERSAGVVTVDYRSAEPYSAATKQVNVDKFIIELGFSALGDQWRYIYRKEAREILHRILERDLAYQSPIISSARAEVLADREMVDASQTDVAREAARKFSDAFLESMGVAP